MPPRLSGPPRRSNDATVGARAVRTWLVATQTDHVLWAGAAAAAVVELVAGPLAVPGRDGLAAVVWPLTPALIAAALPTPLRASTRALERTAARTDVAQRSLVLLAATVAVVVLSAAWHSRSAEVLARNGVLMLGLASIACVVLPARVQWMPPTLVPMAMWLFGARPPGEEPAAWAVLLHPAGGPESLGLLCVGVYLVGVAVVVCRGPSL